MQQFQELYNSKLTTPDEAVSRCLHSGAVCASDIALAHSSLFYEAVGRAIAEGRLDDITQHTLLDTGAFPFYRPEFAGKYHGVSWFSQGPARKAINGGFGLVLDGSQRVDEIIKSSLMWDVMGGVARRSWARNENSISTSVEYNQNYAGKGHITLPFIADEALVERVIRESK